MRAISYNKFGSAHDALNISEIETPALAAGEVLVSLKYSGVNPSDVKSRMGRPGRTRPAFEQIVPHSDGAGTITAVGAGVDPARVGARVWLWNGQWQRAFGTCAESIVVPSDQAVDLPAEISLETGASLGIPGLTACHAVFGSGDVAGQTVLVQGGAGMVGQLAVQLARWGGAKVIATARGTGVDVAQAAGADVVLDYADPDLAAAILTANGGQPVDRIVEVEFGINTRVDAAVIKRNGVIAAYGSAKNMTPELPFFELLFKAVTIDIVLIYLLEAAPRTQAIARLNAAMTEGALNIPVAQIFPLAETADAHVAVEEANRQGAILVDVTA